MPILFRLRRNLLFGVWRKLNKQSGVGEGGWGHARHQRSSQTDLKQTRLPGLRRSKYTISARSRRLNSTGERQQLRKEVVHAVYWRGGNLWVTQRKVYLSRRRVNRRGGCASVFYHKARKCCLSRGHDTAGEHWTENQTERTTRLSKSGWLISGNRSTEEAQREDFEKGETSIIKY